MAQGIGRRGEVKNSVRWRRRVTAGLLTAGFLVPGFVAPAMGAAAAPSCTAAGSTGLSAAMVVTTNVSNVTVNAAGCDIGIYVPPGTSGITISGVTVSGANDHGIFVQDASGVTITGSTVDGNGVAPTAGISENKAIQLVGTSNSTVTANTVTGNLADGGIGIADDGNIDPGAPKPGTASPATNDTVSNNRVSGNYGGCGIVLASYNSSGLSADTVKGNTVTGSPGQFGPHGPVIGSVVIAADTPGAQVANIAVTGNTVTGAFIPVVVHSNAPGDRVSGVSITANTISGDDWGAVDGPPSPAGIIVAVSPLPPPATPVLTGTTITANTFSGEHFDIWVSGATQTTTSPNGFAVTPGGLPVFDVPPPGSGYWMTAKDGGVFSFGAASFFGSAAGTRLASPVVALAPTLDQGGYWLATAAGGIVPFGDASSYGSLSGKPLNKPIVGIAPTPLVPAPPGAPSTGPAGKGYWLVAADGGVFSFGDAGFYGSTAGMHLNQPVVGMAAVGPTLAG